MLDIPQVPTVDVAKLLAHTNVKDAGKEFGEAFSKMGVVYLVNHGLDVDLINKIFKQSSELFNLPKEIRKTFTKTDPVKDFDGFNDIGEENLDEVLAQTYEVKQLFDMNVITAKFPAQVPELESAVKESFQIFKKMTSQFFRWTALAMDVDEELLVNSSTYLDGRMDHPNWTFMRLNKYPRVSNLNDMPVGAVRCAEHVDWTLMSFLLQDSVGGLEAKTREGQWIPVTPVPNSILLNAGEMLEIISRGYFPAVRHRVLLSDEEKRCQKDRYSFAFFTFPDYEFMLGPCEKNDVLTDDCDFVNKTVRQQLDIHIKKTRNKY